MRNADRSSPECSVADLPAGVRARVVAIDQAGARPLAAHGVIVGARLSVEADAPFGGPRIVRLGAARVALARSVARTIRVHAELPAEAGPDAGTR